MGAHLSNLLHLLLHLWFSFYRLLLLLVIFNIDNNIFAWLKTIKSHGCSKYIRVYYMGYVGKVPQTNTVSSLLYSDPIYREVSPFGGNLGFDKIKERGQFKRYPKLFSSNKANKTEFQSKFSVYKLLICAQCSNKLFKSNQHHMTGKFLDS